MTEMTREEVRRFLGHGTFTGKLATIRKDGSPHVAPVWFVLDENSNDDVILTTSHESIKGKCIISDPRVSISVDDQKPPYSFATMCKWYCTDSEESSDLLNTDIYQRTTLNLV